MKVIGAGYGRTGTLSLKQALEELGFGPCYHMVELLNNGSHVDKWLSAYKEQASPWQDIFQNYQATVDAPGCFFYKELMAAYPEAKVILTLRDPERWYDSVKETVYQSHKLPRWMGRIPGIGNVKRLTDGLLWDGILEGKFEDRARTIKLFNEHIAEVQQTVPPEKLLVFRVQDGWEPLCQFLDVPMPDRPFPHVNDRAEMQARMAHAHQMAQTIPIVVGIVAGLIALLIVRILNKRWVQFEG